MIAAPFASSVEREQVVDFTESYFLEYTSILVRYLDLGADKWRLYLKVGFLVLVNVLMLMLLFWNCSRFGGKRGSASQSQFSSLRSSSGLRLF